MKTKKLSVIIILFLICSPLFSQTPCPKYDMRSYFIAEKDANYPPLHTYMPLDVLIGYIAADSACKQPYSGVMLTDFIDRQIYNDTLRYMMKYFYIMADYNPVIFYYYLQFAPFGYYPPQNIEMDILNKVTKVSPMPYVHRLLLASYYILHISVIDTVRVPIDGILCQNISIVKATVLDTIKGQVLPDYNLFHPIISKDKEKPESYIPHYFEFQYCLEWRRGRKPGITDSAGAAWVKPNREYLVFLSTRYLCQQRDSINVYYEIYPVTLYAMSAGMFPIVDGNVIDEGNDFGWGTSLPYIDFINNLNNVIHSIVNYPNE